MSLRATHFSPHIGNGGLGQSIPRLCRALSARGNEIRLHVLEPAGEAAPPGVALIVHPRSAWLKPLGISTSLKLATQDEATRRADVLHVHSLWTMASIYPGRARRDRCRLVHSPRGAMAPWAMAHHKWRKRLVWPLLQRAAVANADCFVVTSEKELADVRRLGFAQPAAIVPNGVDIPQLNFAAKPPAVPRRLLFLGRVHPVKAIDRLLYSWSLLQARFAEWELVVAGEDDGGYLAKMQALSVQLKLERVVFTGRVCDPERNALYQSADLFVLPSHTENFGIVVAEALANGVPAVVSRFAPWNHLEAEGCGWWPDTHPPALAECLASAMALPAAALQSMGARGREWMIRDFSWARAAEMTELTYRWLLGGGNAPGWIG